MPFWSHHKLAGPSLPSVDIEVNERCHAVADLPGVPTGTEGRVLMAAGFEWLRFRVRFDNGVELNGLDARHIAAD